MLSENVQGRLYNWKFESAWEYMQEDMESGPYDESEADTIKALSDTFGNAGWFDGSMANIVRAAVWYLGVEDD